MDKLELARKLAQKINFQHQHNAAAANQQNTASQQAAEYIMKGGVIQPSISAKTVAEQVNPILQFVLFIYRIHYNEYYYQYHTCVGYMCMKFANLIR